MYEFKSEKENYSLKTNFGVQISFLCFDIERLKLTVFE
jgi:hypothetical protein